MGCQQRRTVIGCLRSSFPRARAELGRSHAHGRAGHRIHPRVVVEFCGARLGLFANGADPQSMSCFIGAHVIGLACGQVMA